MAEVGHSETAQSGIAFVVIERTERARGSTNQLRRRERYQAVRDRGHPTLRFGDTAEDGLLANGVDEALEPMPWWPR
jgi:hypothetical protein